MKSKFVKIWGIVLTVMILASLLVFVTPTPTSAGTLSWTSVNTPSTTSQVLVTNGKSWMMDVAPDGKTIFAYDNTTLTMYKSTNGGTTWSTSGVGTFLTEGGVNFTTANISKPTVVAMVISPNYATDSTVLLADSGNLYRSADGGATFIRIPISSVGAITSVDIGPYYTGSTAIVVGGSTGAALSASQFGFSSIFSGNVLGVALSPNVGDAEILIVTNDGANTFLRAKIGTNAFDVDFNPATITSAYSVANAKVSIVFGADYNTGSNKVLVGLGHTVASADAGQDVYRVSLLSPPVSSTAADLNVQGSTLATNVYSLSFKGNLADGWLFAGDSVSGTVWRATSVAGSPGFIPASKNPSGSIMTIVAASQVAADANIFAITSGQDSAFSVSTDGGVNFNQISLIGVANTVTTITDLAAIDANTMFLVLTDGARARLFMTTNAGANWMSVSNMTFMSAITRVYPSPAYATDKTIYVTQDGTSRIWKSIDAGVSYTGLSAPNGAIISSFFAVDGADYFVGTTTGIYKRGLFVSGAGVSAPIKSIARVDASNLFVGTDGGKVYMSTNDGTSFSEVKSGASAFTGGNTYVLPDVAYATNRTAYAGNVAGVKRINVDTGAVWTDILSTGVLPVSGNVDSGATGLKQGSEGTLYAFAGNAEAVYRSVDPLGPAIPGISPTFEMVKSISLPGWPADAIKTVDVDVFATGTVAVPNNTLYAVVDTSSADKVMTFQDTLVVAPTASGPASGASVNQDFNFTWAPLAGAQSYQIQYATDPAFISGTKWPANSTNTAAGSSVQGPLGLDRGAQVWWTLQAMTPLRSKKSAPIAFSIKLTESINEFIMVAPTPAATAIALRPSFQWSAINGATGYDLQVADNPVFVNPIDDQKNLATTVWTLTKTLENNKVYYWRVRAVNSNSGVVGDWLQGTFTTVGVAVTTTPPVFTQTILPAPTFTITQPPNVTITQLPQPTVTVVIPPATTKAPATPAYIWVIIAIGAILVIAVIVLIARTRRV